MRVFIAGIDGYLGWPLALHFASRGYIIGGADNFSRRKWVEEVGGESIIPIHSISERSSAFQEHYHKSITFYEGDLCDYTFVKNFLEDFKPDAIVHLGEMPSAPYSMIDVRHAVFTQTNNLVSTLNILFAIKDTCPDAHLIKLGTMGEYGTPNIDIPEGFFEIEYRGRRDTLPFPRQAPSWYHWSKVYDSNNVMFGCKIWGLRATDIMQGVVYGTRFYDIPEDERLFTRFDIDQCFGTVVNRFCAQAIIAHPLTLYGKGYQRRGFIPLSDSIQCLTIALEKQPKQGEYRVLNQFAEVYSLTEIALKVQKVGKDLGLNIELHNFENPRIEKEKHYYRVDHKHLMDLGYKPTYDMESELKLILSDLIKYHDRIEKNRHVLIPDIRWDGTQKKVCKLNK